MTLYDLREICRGEGRQTWPSTIANFKELGLLKSDGQPLDVVKDVVLSAVRGEGLQLQLYSPYAETPMQERQSRNWLHELLFRGNNTDRAR